jgi:hypothetical protein
LHGEPDTEEDTEDRKEAVIEEELDEALVGTAETTDRVRGTGLRGPA